MIEGANCNKMFENGTMALIMAPVVAGVLTISFLILANGPGGAHGCFLPSAHPIVASIIYGPEALLFVYGLSTIAVAKCIQLIQVHRKRQAFVQPDHTIHDNL